MPLTRTRRILTSLQNGRTKIMSVTTHKPMARRKEKKKKPNTKPISQPVHLCIIPSTALPELHNLQLTSAASLPLPISEETQRNGDGSRSRVGPLLPHAVEGGRIPDSEEREIEVQSKSRGKKNARDENKRMEHKGRVKCNDNYSG